MKTFFAIAVAVAMLAAFSSVQAADVRLGGGLIFDGTMPGGGGEIDIPMGDRPAATRWPSPTVQRDSARSGAGTCARSPWASFRQRVKSSMGSESRSIMVPPERCVVSHSSALPATLGRFLFGRPRRAASEGVADHPAYARTAAGR